MSESKQEPKPNRASTEGPEPADKTPTKRGATTATPRAPRGASTAKPSPGTLVREPQEKAQPRSGILSSGDRSQPSFEPSKTAPSWPRRPRVWPD